MSGCSSAKRKCKETGIGDGCRHSHRQNSFNLALFHLTSLCLSFVLGVPPLDGIESRAGAVF
ncbi:uncharacterized protein L969DRAFT_94883 [Mixia osmundae IAM 14324]|uniref:Uncharacterized protein n=1 Tax=Mixia osmundae (strain CBS 9802 / IAM 14324 / JCM 22182 / KY 12970) TaxID=764103 RepID=G7E217_MIXOS|nr:uncharacterized protein L969DRAFT_94883 [Mixia osmundae IAM 14324]KEI38686.1 hypothetical protein L969DRAFT_94883 [Mixia osmundae IAM 14324]GAA96854.1 hypothetical protein E5Q_03527 [Mixia osmundae IAM 14324]